MSSRKRRRTDSRTSSILPQQTTTDVTKQLSSDVWCHILDVASSWIVAVNLFAVCRTLAAIRKSRPWLGATWDTRDMPAALILQKLPEWGTRFQRWTVGKTSNLLIADCTALFSELARRKNPPIELYATRPRLVKKFIHLLNDESRTKGVIREIRFQQQKPPALPWDVGTMGALNGNIPVSGLESVHKFLNAGDFHDHGGRINPGWMFDCAETQCVEYYGRRRCMKLCVAICPSCRLTYCQHHVPECSGCDAKIQCISCDKKTPRLIFYCRRGKHQVCSDCDEQGHCSVNRCGVFLRQENPL